MEQNGNHTLSMLNRETLNITGVNDVDSFNEEEIMAFTDYGDLTIKGEMLHVEELNLECGEMKVSGKITALLYTDKSNTKSAFRRLFGG